MTAAGRFTRGTGPFIHVVPQATSGGLAVRIETMATAARPGTIVRTIDGRRCTSSAGFFTEIAAALEFPAYFGHNWDALNDCLIDMGWLPAPGYVVVMTEAELAFTAPGGNDAWAVLGELLNVTTADDSVPLHLCLESDGVESLVQRLSAADVVFDVIAPDP